MAVLEEAQSSVPTVTGKPVTRSVRAGPAPRPPRVVIYTLVMRELESPSTLGDGGRRAAVPGCPCVSPHPPRQPAVPSPGEALGTSGELASTETDVGVKRSELNLSVPAFPQFGTTPPHLGDPARTALGSRWATQLTPTPGKDGHPGSVLPALRLVRYCRSVDESRATLGTCGRGGP